MARRVRPLHNVRPAIVSTAFVAILRAPEAARLVRQRKSFKGATGRAAPLLQPKIPMANASAVIAMVRGPVHFTMARRVVRLRNACPAIVSMAFVAAMRALEPAWLAPLPNAARASTVNVDPLPPIPIPTTNVPTPNAADRIRAIWRKV